MKNIRTQDTQRLEKKLELEQKLVNWEGFYGESNRAHALNTIDTIKNELERRCYW